MTNTNYFKGVKTLEELKKLYFKLAKMYHPDRGGDVETMQAINNEYDTALKHFEKYGSRTEQAAAHKEGKAPEQFKNLIAALLKRGIDLEIIGNWIWIKSPGVHLSFIKSAGFLWSTKQKQYYKPAPGTEGGRASRYKLQEIREIYGFTEMKAEEQQQKALA